MNTKKSFNIKNPFNIKEIPKKELYLSLFENAKNKKYTTFHTLLNELSKYKANKEFIDNLALSTQITIKKRKISKLIYLHGYLLYSSLCKYISNYNKNEEITILETGTARGFSAICMAKALQDMNIEHAKIYTIDILPKDISIYWKCIHDCDGKNTRFELLKQWKELVDKYIVFLEGNTTEVLKKIQKSGKIKRIHFAFLDAQHKYENVKEELNFVYTLQKQKDVIICDDYTLHQYPGIVKAIDEHIIKTKCKFKKFISDKESKRGYVYLEK